MNGFNETIDKSNNLFYIFDNFNNNKINHFFNRNGAFDDLKKKKKEGIYREKIIDNDDLDKKGNPKIKFKYFYMNSNQPVSEEDLIRIKKLNLAPAYEDVWISIDPKSKIQATGIDARGRKQYRYSQEHIEKANIKKFLRLYKFIKKIPVLNDELKKDFTSELYSKQRGISLMLLIIQELNLRVGKECYAKTNKSYGLTSLKKSHIKIDKEKLIAKFNFKAKSNKYVSYTLKDKILVNELLLLMDLEGEKIFQYRAKNNSISRITDIDLNNYIQMTIGKNFTCKDFRTYAANFYFIKSLLKETKNRTPSNLKITKKNLTLAQENTAFYLRHTKSISKKSYTMDLIRNMYLNDTDYFIKNKNKNPLKVLINLLKIYKESLKKKIE